MVWSGQTLPKQNMAEALFLIIFVKKKNMLAYVFVFNELLSTVKRCADNVFVAKSLLDLHTYCVLKMILGAVTLTYTTLEVRTSYK